MAKFYVQSGTLRTVIDSVDVDRAALWAVHRAMQQIVPFEGENEAKPNEKSLHLKEAGFIVLGDTIEISEIGFDHDDAVRVETFDAFHEWHCLAQALDRLEKQLLA
jgi:hypothetical protein